MGWAISTLHNLSHITIDIIVVWKVGVKRDVE